MLLVFGKLVIWNSFFTTETDVLNTELYVCQSLKEAQYSLPGCFVANSELPETL